MIDPQPGRTNESEAAFLRVGVDLGGTKTEAVVLDAGGSELARRRVLTDRTQGYEGVVAGTVALVRAVISEVDSALPVRIGIGIPGMWDAARGVVNNANTTELIGRPLRTDFERELGRPIAIANDANCFALAEARAGAARGRACVFGVIMGTGCGGGLVIEGAVRDGPNGIAGEWGHVSIDPGGPECYCGKRGCVETFISGGGLQDRFFEATGRRTTAQKVVELSRTGDAAAVRAIDNFLDAFGRALGGLISVLDPDIVVLGGGLSNVPEVYERGIPLVRKYAFHPEIRTPIVKNELGDSAGVIGAAWIGV